MWDLIFGVEDYLRSLAGRPPLKRGLMKVAMFGDSGDPREITAEAVVIRQDGERVKVRWLGPLSGFLAVALGEWRDRDDFYWLGSDREPKE